MKCGCGNNIHPERVSLGYKICVECGEKVARMKRPVGYMHYGHKTAGAIVITSQTGLKNYKKVSHRRCKGSHMGYASNVGTNF